MCFRVKLMESFTLDSLPTLTEGLKNIIQAEFIQPRGGSLLKLYILSSA